MNKKHLIGVTALALLLGFSFTSCKTVEVLGGGVSAERGSYETIRTPAKDFNTLGLVFAEAVKELKDESVSGDVLIYQKLLQEAKKLNGDYIINVVIDRKFSGTQKKFGRFVIEFKGTEYWYGSAVAIKYTNSLNQSTIDSSALPGGQTTTRTVTNPIMNNSGSGDSSSNSGGGFFKSLKRKK